MSHPQALRGAIVRCERFIGVAWGSVDDGLVVFPVEKTATRHRSDVAHDEPLLCSKRVIRAGEPMKIKSAMTIVGRVSNDTIARIQLAMRREADARRFEDRHHVKIEAPSHQSVRF